MASKLAWRLAAVGVLLGGSWLAFTQGQQQAQPLKVNKVTDDLYELEGDGGNVAVYVTSEGAIVVDDKYERNYDDIVANVKKLTDKPVKYLLNTHHHGDHTGSNGKFTTTQIVAHRNVRVNMEKGKQAGPPGVTYSNEAQVYLGGKTVELHYYGRSHTNGDSVIYFPALKTVHFGDMFVQGPPLIDYSGGGSIVDWTNTLDGALKLDFETAIPGHGPIMKKADVVKFRNDIVAMRTRVSSAIKGGASQDQVTKLLTSEFGWQEGGMQLRMGGPGMYNELKAAN